MYAREKAPSLIDPAGPTISLISAEPVFVMAAALNACGYDEGLEASAPIRKHVRDEMIRPSRKVRMPAPGVMRSAYTLPSTHDRLGARTISQYISLALYSRRRRNSKFTADLTEMPPDSTQVLRSFPCFAPLRPRWTCTAFG